MDSDWYYAWKWLQIRLKLFGQEVATAVGLHYLCSKKAIESNDEELAKQVTLDLRDAYSTLFPKGNFHDFSIYNIQLEKIRFNAAGFVNEGLADHLTTEFLRNMLREQG